MFDNTNESRESNHHFLSANEIYLLYGALYVRSVQIIYKINIKAVRRAWLVGSPNTYCLYSDYTYTYKYSGEVFTRVLSLISVKLSKHIIQRIFY